MVRKDSFGALLLILQKHSTRLSSRTPLLVLLYSSFISLHGSDVMFLHDQPKCFLTHLVKSFFRIYEIVIEFFLVVTILFTIEQIFNLRIVYEMFSDRQTKELHAPCSARKMAALFSPASPCNGATFL